MILKLELQVCSVRLSKRSWVVLVITYPLFLHHLIGPLNIIDQSYCRTYSFTCTCCTVNLTETVKYETLRSLERRKKGKLLSSLSLWAPTQVAVCLILPLLIIMKQIQEKKEEMIWLSPMTTWQHKNAAKTLITQQFRTDLGGSVGVTTATKLVWLNQFTWSQPSHQSNFY